jgi:signal transduction histidine kinase
MKQEKHDSGHTTVSAAESLSHRATQQLLSGMLLLCILLLFLVLLLLFTAFLIPETAAAQEGKTAVPASRTETNTPAQLLAQADALLSTDSLRAIAAAEEALDLARAEGAAAEVARALDWLIPVYEERGILDRVYHCLVEKSEVGDSLLSEENAEQVRRLAEKYEVQRKSGEVALLEREKQLRVLELKRRDDDLTRTRLHAARRLRELASLARERDIRQLELTGKEDALALRASSLALQREENVRRGEELSLQEAALEREQLWRGIAGAGLLALLFLLGSRYWNFRNRKRAIALREEAAIYKARAVEARALEEAAAAERRQKQAQQEFASRLIVAQEEERNRIAGALHDGISQDLIIMKFRAAMALKDEGQRKEHVREILGIVGESIEEVRRMSRDLRPSQLERVGLSATLLSMLQSVRESTSLVLQVHIDAVDGLLSSEQEIGLYRIVQEAVNNILKHAGARTVKVELLRSNGDLQLMIRDDGAGFNPEAGNGKGVGFGLGLQGMRERAHMLGGALIVESAPGHGTTLRTSFPLHPVGQEERA